MHAIRMSESHTLVVMVLLCMPRLLCSHYRTTWNQPRTRPSKRTPPSTLPTSLPSKQPCRTAPPRRTAKTLSSWWLEPAEVPSSQLPCRCDTTVTTYHFRCSNNTEQSCRRPKPKISFQSSAIAFNYPALMNTELFVPRDKPSTPVWQHAV